MMKLRRRKLADLVPWTANGKGERRELLASRDGVATDGDNREFSCSLYTYLCLDLDGGHFHFGLLLCVCSRVGFLLIASGWPVWVRNVVLRTDQTPDLIMAYSHVSGVVDALFSTITISLKVLHYL